MGLVTANPQQIDFSCKDPYTSLLLMMYLFVGIAFITERMNDAISVITAKKSWNSAMVNLTLLGIGSALPEIVLCFLNTFTGQIELGSMALIGSASFNVPCISAVAIAFVSTSTSIKKLDVFLLSASFFCFGYLWFFVILSVLTPNYITIAEAVATLCLYPILVGFTWVVEKGAELDDTNVARSALFNMTE